jgi:hypothetical protein
MYEDELPLNSMDPTEAAPDEIMMEGVVVAPNSATAVSP